MLTRLGPLLAIGFLTVPVAFGLAGTALPAFGYFPALGGDQLSLSAFALLFNQPAIAHSAMMSLVTGLVTTGLSVLIVMIFVAAWGGTRVFSRIQSLLSPLLSVPHAAAAFALAFLIAPSGMLARLVSPQLTGWQRPPDLLIVHDPMGLSLMLGLVAKEVPFLLLMTLAALQQIEGARMRRVTTAMGYGRIAGFIFGVWPVLYPQLRLPIFAVIAFASSVVDVAAILGPTNPPPLAVRLVQWMNDPDLAKRYLASAGAVLQLGITAIAMCMWIGIERLARCLRRHFTQCGARMQADAAMRWLALAAVAVLAFAIFAGFVTLGLWSFARLWQYPDALPASFKLKTWLVAVPRLADPLMTTLVVALAATAIALIVVVLSLLHEDVRAKRPGRGVLTLLYLPLMVPQVAFLFGMQFLFIISGYEASYIALVLAHLVFVLPYVYLCLKDPWHAFDRRYDQIAAALGKSRWQRFVRVRLPMMMRPLLTVTAIGLSVSIGLYLPTLLIGMGRLTTVTTEAVALAAGGNPRLIGAYALIQTLLPALGFALAIFLPALIFRRFRDMQV